MNMPRLRLWHVAVGLGLWIAMMLVTVLLTATAQFADRWDGGWGFWVWALGWLVFSVLIVWLVEEA